MNRAKLKFTVYLMITLFGFNYFASTLNQILLQYTPEAYKIDTSSVKNLSTFFLDHGLIYILNLFGYFLIFIFFVMILILFELKINEELHWKKFLHAAKRPKLYGFVLGIILLFWPLNELGLRVPIANYITIPQTFLSMISNQYIWGLFWLFYAIVILIAIRLKNILHYLIIDDIKHENLMKKSWQATKNTFLKNFSHLLIIFGKLAGLVLLLTALQSVIDLFNSRGLSVSTTNLFVSILAGALYFTTAEILLLFIADSFGSNANSNKKWAICTQMVLFIATLSVGFSSIFLSGKILHVTNQDYLIIAHMGISKKTDIPNSIASLKKAHGTKTDYVEIDIQKTKDGQYVLSHDANITSIDGKSYKIQNYSWDNLKNISFISNQKKTKLTDFKAYLELANSLNQKILVELKFNQTVSNNELKEFAVKYGKLLAENHAQLQSLNQNSLARIHKYLDNDLGLLSPVNNTINNSKLSQFYSIEYSSLNQNTVNQAISNNKLIYAWTIDSKVDLATTFAYGVQGFITDTPGFTRNYLQQIAKHPHFSNVIRGSLLFKRVDF